MGLIERIHHYLNDRIQDPQRFDVIPGENGYYVHDLITDAEYFLDNHGGLVDAGLYGESIPLPEELEGGIIIAVQKFQKKNPLKGS